MKVSVIGKLIYFLCLKITYDRPRARHFCNLTFPGLKERFFSVGTNVLGPEKIVYDMFLLALTC